jgi:hypothetical protein
MMKDFDITKNKQNLGKSLTRRVSVQHHLGYSGRFSINRKISIFNNLGVGWKRTAPNARRLQAESRYGQL